jgi:uncharacterized membrane protein YphA (DoxX/SURF4 family)
VTNKAQPPASAPPGRWRLWTARAGRAALGLIFLVAASLKAIDPAGFAAQIEAYGWLPGDWIHQAAIFFIVIEFLLGAALVVDVLPRLASAGMGTLLVLFLVVLTEAWYNGKTVDCGCFGGQSGVGPGEGAIRDVGFLALLVPTLLWGARPTGARWRAGVVAATVVVGLGLTLAAPSLPLDGLLTKLSLGADLEALELDALVPEQGAVFVALLDLEGESSRQVVPALNDLALDVMEADMLAFAAAGPEPRFLFGMEQGAGFPVEEIGSGTLGSLARKLPRFALLVDGKVVAVWNEQPPDAGSLRSVLEGGTS